MGDKRAAPRGINDRFMEGAFKWETIERQTD
jgi:hypothetical protein